MADEKARSGRDVPQLNWRYILFNWNDDDAEMSRARALAARPALAGARWLMLGPIDSSDPDNAAILGEAVLPLLRA